jgi:hypothetical protein
MDLLEAGPPEAERLPVQRHGRRAVVAAFTAGAVLGAVGAGYARSEWLQRQAARDRADAVALVYAGVGPSEQVTAEPGMVPLTVTVENASPEAVVVERLSVGLPDSGRADEAGSTPMLSVVDTPRPADARLEPGRRTTIAMTLRVDCTTGFPTAPPALTVHARRSGPAGNGRERSVPLTVTDRTDFLLRLIEGCRPTSGPPAPAVSVRPEYLDLRHAADGTAMLRFRLRAYGRRPDATRVTQFRVGLGGTAQSTAPEVPFVVATYAQGTSVVVRLRITDCATALQEEAPDQVFFSVADPRGGDSPRLQRLGDGRLVTDLARHIFGSCR